MSVKWAEEHHILWDKFGETIRAKDIPNRQCEELLSTYSNKFHSSCRWKTIKAWCSNKKARVLQNAQSTKS